jgi:hypothetical protein
MNKLAFSTATYLALRERLLAAEPNLDERTLADTIEGLTDLHEIVAAIVRSAIVDEALAEGLRDRIGEMQGRLERLEDRASKRRQIARDVMTEAAIKTILAPDFTISVRPGNPGLAVIDEALIPQSYWVPREPRLDRQALHADLKRDIEIPGVVLKNPEPVLSVRVK